MQSVVAAYVTSMCVCVYMRDFVDEGNVMIGAASENMIKVEWRCSGKSTYVIVWVYMLKARFSLIECDFESLREMITSG